MNAKKISLTALALAVGIMGSSAIAQTRYFSFVTANHPQLGMDATTFGTHEFVIAADPILAKKIESIIKYEYFHIGLQDMHVQGRIVRGRVAYNEEYPFHLDPSSITLFRDGAKQCDATAFEVEDNIERVGVPNSGFLADGHWCPQSSRFIREIVYPHPSGGR